MRWTVERTRMFLKYRLVVPLFFLGVGLPSVAIAQSAGTFTGTGNLTTSEAFPRATLLSNGKVLITGLSTELYDPSFGTFSATGNAGILGGQSATRLADGRVLIAGGNRAELYDPRTDVHRHRQYDHGPIGTQSSPVDERQGLTYWRAIHLQHASSRYQCRTL